MEHIPKARYVDFSPDEFIAGVSGKMTPEQIGVYWTICSLIYSKGGPIDNDPIWLGNIMGGVHWRTVRKVLNGLIKMGKVQAKDGQVWVQRCSTELAKTEHRINTARANGKQGGRPPKENNDIEEPDGSYEEKLTINNQQPTTNNQPIEEAPTQQRGDVILAFEAYNRVAGEIGIPIARDLTDTRKKKLKARLQGCGGLDGWEAALEKVRASPGLLGENDRGWRADLDFMLTESKFTKLMEGSYDNWKPNNNGNGGNAQGGRGQPASIAASVNRFVAARSDG